MPFIFTLSFLIVAAFGCTFCSTINGANFYCPNNCGSIINGQQFCSDGTAAVISPCCQPDRPQISSSVTVEKATCGANPQQQQFTYNPSTGQFSITTTTGSQMCLEVYWGDFCNLFATPLVFIACDSSRTNQLWVQSGTKIFSKVLFGGVRTFCMSSAGNLYGSQASVELATTPNSNQDWSFNWGSNSGTLQNSATGACMQMPIALFGTTTQATTTHAPTACKELNLLFSFFFFVQFVQCLKLKPLRPSFIDCSCAQSRACFLKYVPIHGD